MSAGPAAADTARHVHGTTKNRVDAFIGLNSAIGSGLTNISKSSSESMTMKITCECENRKEYDKLIEQLREENMNFSATEQKHITEWWNEDDPFKEPVIFHDYRVVFWYSGKLI